MTPYNVFISWSREPSKSVALVISKWLKQVIQSSNAFMSDEGIGSGDVGLWTIAQQLDAIKIGLFICTNESQHRRWVNYEAGAISKGQNDNKVVPLLFDMAGEDLELPLNQYQYRDLFEESDMWKLTKDVALALNAPIGGDDLKEAFESRWPSLLTKLTTIRDSGVGEAKKPPRDDEKKLDEVLLTVRSLANEIAQLRQAQTPSSRRYEEVLEYIPWIKKQQMMTRLAVLSTKPIAELTVRESMAVQIGANLPSGRWTSDIIDSLEGLIGPSLIPWKVSGDGPLVLTPSDLEDAFPHLVDQENIDDASAQETKGL